MVLALLDRNDIKKEWKRFRTKVLFNHLVFARIFYVADQDKDTRVSKLSISCVSAQLHRSYLEFVENIIRANTMCLVIKAGLCLSFEKAL